ncbi:orotidine 5'-phosphate decarboxylase [Serendipita sp. 405]|nr:orotidine 5'-phosphate decarboxylase [Serendipita sp. 405]
MTSTIRTKTYLERSKAHTNPAAKKLLEIMDRKQSNLCLSIDVTKKENLLKIVDAVGDALCLVKTHIDIVEDFDQDLIEKLQELSEKHDFLIFEDRKFADIGNTVAHQYAHGIYHIASWAHITNAHPVPGPGIIQGLASVGLPLGRGLLLLAEMSSAGTLANGEYTKTAIEMARESNSNRRRNNPTSSSTSTTKTNPESHSNVNSNASANASSNSNFPFVIGFIAMERIEDRFPLPLQNTQGDTTTPQEEEEDFLVLTPGVGVDVSGDGLGQQYRTPHQVVFERGCDVIIVGRGIYGKGDDLEEMKRRAALYRQLGWEAYLQRIGSTDS